MTLSPRHQISPAVASRLRLRLLIAILLGIIALAVLGGMTFGFMHAGSPWDAWPGVHGLGGSRFEATEAVPASGVQAGDVLALADLPIAQRFAFRFVETGESFPCPVERQGVPVVVNCPFGPAIPLAPVGGTIDIVFRLLLLCSGLLVIVRGRDRPALWAGIFLGSEALADTLIMTFTGLPIAAQVAGILVSRVARLVAYFALFAFGLGLLDGASARLRRVLWSIFAAGFAVVAVLQMNAPTDLLFGRSVIAVPLAFNYLPHIVMQVYALGVIGAAALRARGERKLAVRVIFWGMLLVVVAFAVPALYLADKKLPPVWMFIFFNLAHGGIAVGFPWAILRQKLVTVDFLLNRAAISLIAAGIVVFLINLLETAAENNVAGFESSTLLQYAVPIVVGISFGALQSAVGQGLERTLYRDRLRAEQTLQALIARMPEAPTVAALAAEVVPFVARTFRVHVVTLYVCGSDRAPLRPVASHGNPPAERIARDDPAFRERGGTSGAVVLDGITGSGLASGSLFPLRVFGRLVGALYCDRSGDESFDPAEGAMLLKLTGELSIGIAWLGQMFGG